MGLRPRNLTTTQSGYASVYESGNVLVPTQDYKRQGLVKAQQYTVLAQDRSTNQLTLETPMGQILTINPAQCRKKTVYEMHSIPIAVGDRLRWTKNNRDTGIRNGQTFIVNHVALDGTAQITDSDGKTMEINLSGRQYLDYAWVSTTYSSQRKTADRVLALMDGITTNRESFYVTVSRAKHHLTLYTADKVALTNLAQRTKNKENVSDYIPLFQVVPNHAQTAQTPLQFIPASDAHRNLAKRVGERVGNRICQKLTADRPGTDCSAAASIPTGTAISADAPDVAAFASTLEPHVERLSGAIADFLEERSFIKCAGELAEAVTAVNRSLEYLEHSTENRTYLAATIDRLDAAVGTTSQHLQQLGRFRSRSESIQQRSQAVASPIAIIRQTLSRHSDLEHTDVRLLTNTTLPSSSLYPSLAAVLGETNSGSQEHYQQMWQRYSQGICFDTLVKLDFWVSQRALENGHSRKEIALMLIASSPYVAKIHQDYGKDKARSYVNQATKVICQKNQHQEWNRPTPQKKQLEL
ncbi:hypothetical protein [Egbenema bharatensis]|uniref:hypothetical protein n=1 Tax=Egbenema bharatensis TaxID=3463334 RepID=UPI003A85FA02